MHEKFYQGNGTMLVANTLRRVTHENILVDARTNGKSAMCENGDAIVETCGHQVRTCEHVQWQL